MAEINQKQKDKNNNRISTTPNTKSKPQGHKNSLKDVYRCFPYSFSEIK